MDIKNFKYEVINKDDLYHQVLVTLQYDKFTFNKTLFILNSNNAEDLYYIDEAKKKIAALNSSGKLDNYINKKIKKLNKKPIKNKKLFFAITGCAVIAVSIGGGFLINFLVNKDNCYVKITNEDENKGTLRAGGTFKKGSTLLLEAKAKDKYQFAGWYEVDGDSHKVVSFASPTFYQVKNNVEIIGKWEDYSTLTFAFNMQDNYKFALSSYYGDSKEIIIPGQHFGVNVERIKPYTFAYKCNESVIKFNEGITTLDSNAFTDCKANEIYLPESLTNLSDTVFKNWSSTQTIYVSTKSIEQGGSKTKWGWDLINKGDYYITEHSTCGSKEVHIKIK